LKISSSTRNYIFNIETEIIKKQLTLPDTIFNELLCHTQIRIKLSIFLLNFYQKKIKEIFLNVLTLSPSMIISLSSFGHILGSLDKDCLDLNMEKQPFSQEKQVGNGK
jgi:hypothetical protein